MKCLVYVPALDATKLGKPTNPVIVLFILFLTADRVLFAVVLLLVAGGSLAEVYLLSFWWRHNNNKLEDLESLEQINKHGTQEYAIKTSKSSKDAQNNDIDTQRVVPEGLSVVTKMGYLQYRESECIFILEV